MPTHVISVEGTEPDPATGDVAIIYETPSTLDFTTTNNTFILNTGLEGVTYQKSRQVDAYVLGREFLLSDLNYKFSLKNPDRNVLISGDTVLTIDGVEQTGTLAEKADILKSVFFLTSASNLQEVLDAGSTLNKQNIVSIGSNSLDLFAGASSALKYTDLFVFEDYVYMYAQDDGNNNNSLVEVKWDRVKIQQNGAAALSKIEFRDGRIIAVTPDDYNERDVVAVRVEDDFADDAAAATGGIPVGRFYHTSGVIKIRLV